MEQRVIVRSLTFKGLKAKKIEMELTNVYGDEALQISIVTNWRTRFLQRRTELGDDPRSGRPIDSDLTQGIAEIIRERPFLSCKILCKHLRVSKETCLRILHEKLGLKKFIFDGFYTNSPRTEHESLMSCHVTSFS
jgi:transposase